MCALARIGSFGELRKLKRIDARSHGSLHDFTRVVFDSVLVWVFIQRINVRGLFHWKIWWSTSSWYEAIPSQQPGHYFNAIVACRELWQSDQVPLLKLKSQYDTHGCSISYQTSWPSRRKSISNVFFSEGKSRLGSLCSTAFGHPRPHSSRWHYRSGPMLNESCERQAAAVRSVLPRIER